ncbi:hypothetical protein BU17DRAFT_51474 [Hysterangium stoloniferum]|nr:hypothetical protein BU17DRAFT_51474 [Hysterangium stoloniferum]
MPEITLPYLGPRPNPTASYFKRANPGEDGEENKEESDLLKSIKRVVRPARPRHVQHSHLYPRHDISSDENRAIDQELAWNNKCVVLSMGAVIRRKWTFEHEGQDIRWACKGLFELPGGITNSPVGSFSSAYYNETKPFASTSPSTFSSFAENVQARQRSVESPRRVPAVFIFLRNLGKVYADGGEYTFHLPFLVRRVWPLRPHGVLMEREVTEYEVRETARAGMPILPTLFSLHDPFAEPKVVGLAARIHGALGLGPTVTPDSVPPASTEPERLKIPGHHRYAHQVHLTVWRYAYFKPREIPDPVTSRRKRARGASVDETQDADVEPGVPPLTKPDDLQNKTDKVAPSSPELVAAPPAGYPPLSPPPGTVDAVLPFAPIRQPIAAQPTLTSLPGGELPASWSQPFQQPHLGLEHPRRASQGQVRTPSLSATIDRMGLNGHKKMQPSVWVEKIAAVPMPFEDMRHVDNITVHLFDTRSDQRLDRSLLAFHFPGHKILSIYTLARVPAEDTLRLYPPMHIPALSAVAVSALRSTILDLLIVKPDNTLAIFTHGTRLADDGASDISMRSLVDKEKIVKLSEPLHASVTVHFEDGSTTRTKMECVPHDQLTGKCFWVLSFALMGQRAFDLQRLWLAKWSAVEAVEEGDGEWICFVDAVCELLKVESPYPHHGVILSVPGSWEALAFSHSHTRLQDDVVIASLDAPFAQRRTYTNPPQKPAEDTDMCLLALHLLGESFKLKTDAVHAFLPRLAKLLIALGRAIRPEWADYWARLYPENIEGWANPKREDHNASSRLRPQPPDLYLYLFARLVEPSSKPGWTAMAHIGQMYHFEPAMQYGRSDPMNDLYRLFNVWECFTDPTVQTARKRAENAMHVMIRLGMTNDDLDRLPYGLAQPIREALRTCQTLPSGDWPAQAYQLILRPDLAQMTTGDVFHITSKDSFRQADKHLVSSPFPLATVGELLAEAHVGMDPEPQPVSGVELDLGDFIDIRFGSDRRLQEVARMLQSSSPATVRMPERTDLTELEITREQQTTALRVAERTLALPVGRAMFTFGSVRTVTRDGYQIPKMEFAVRLTPYNTLIAVDVTKMNAEAKNWADFHNGVATGLRMSPSSKMVDSSWIAFNRPTELTAEHAGFLFGLGLSGHLKNMMTWHTFSYLTPKHDLTSIGVLLGLSAANIGTCNRHVTKLLAVHTPALLPNPTVDLNVPMLTQASGLIGTGLLYLGTKNRRMAEVALHEIGRTQLSSADQTTDHREAYTLSAALSFGMIMLAASANNSSPADMNMVSRLRVLIHGEPILPGIRSAKPSFDVTLTSAPATLALALMFLRTGRQDIADILEVPSTLLELHHLQPSFLLVRTLGRALIMWDQIVATPQWVTDQLPKSALEALEKRMMGKHIDESLELAYFNIVSGACFAMGLKFAGTASEDPYSCLIHFHDLFTRISNQNSGQFDHRIKRSAVRDGLNLMSLALAMVMAGTGEINCLRRFRYAHGQATQPSRYGVHMATHMSIGMLFLGGGRYTLGTSDCAIACLLAAFFPRFPTLSHENRGHLQALRHLWVLAVEPRCLIGRDVESNEVVYLPVKAKLKDGNEPRGIQLISPTLFPDINRLISIRVDNPRYFPFFLDIAANPRHREVLLRNQTLWVKRRTGHLGYGEDPRGSRSIYVRSGASSGDAAVLDNPRPSDAYSPSAIEFYQFMSSFSNEPLYVALADRFCGHDENADDEELTFSAFCHAAMLECLTLDRAHMLPTYLSIHLTRRNPTPLALKDLAWHDEFYKNIYDARFSGKGDNAALPPLMRRPLLLAAERTLDLKLRALRACTDLREALRSYHHGMGIMLPQPSTYTEHRAHCEMLRNLGFYLTRTNIPPAGVLERMKAETEQTILLLQANAKGQPMGEDAVRGLLWNTGVLFAGGILRPWSMKALDEVVESWRDHRDGND